MRFSAKLFFYFSLTFFGIEAFAIDGFQELNTSECAELKMNSGDSLGSEFNWKQDTIDWNYKKSEIRGCWQSQDSGQIAVGVQMCTGADERDCDEHYAYIYRFTDGEIEMLCSEYQMNRDSDWSVFPQDCIAMNRRAFSRP